MLPPMLPPRAPALATSAARTGRCCAFPLETRAAVEAFKRGGAVRDAKNVEFVRLFEENAGAARAAPGAEGANDEQSEELHE